jgi:hypothetical protein
MGAGRLFRISFSKFKRTSFISFFIIFLIIFYSSVLLGYGTNTLVNVNPQEKYVGPDVVFTVDINCVPSQPIKSFELVVGFDSSVLQAVNVINGDIFDGYSTFFNPGNINNVIGRISGIYCLIIGAGNVTSPGTMIHVSFIAEDIDASSIIDLVNVGVTNETSYVSVSVSNGVVHVDTIPPYVINNSPSKGFTGDQFAFNATVSDNIDGCENLTVKVDWSHGVYSGNTTMNYAGGFYFTKTITLGINSVNNLNYKFYAVDSFGNSVTTPLSFATVFDNDPPIINSVSASPLAQNIGEYVNISAEITDNIFVNNVGLIIVYPDSYSENFSIVGNKSGNFYFSNKTYALPGFYFYYFCAIDTNNNYIISDENNFIITDINTPVISNINIKKSNPLDTDSSFGWVNISCSVTDNIGVVSVLLNILKPDNSLINISMTHIEGDKYYFNSSTSFCIFGNYTYFIWANDSTDNFITSNMFLVSIPPNWDINMDGCTSILDLILISNYYDYSNTFGWVREDVDNNGIIEVLDLVIVSNHHGETWWV